MLTLEGHRNVVYAIAFNNPYGDKIITGSFGELIGYAFGVYICILVYIGLYLYICVCVYWWICGYIWCEVVSLSIYIYLFINHNFNYNQYIYYFIYM